MKIKILLVFLLLVISCSSVKNSSLITNHDFVESLYNSDLDYSNTDGLFGFVFSQLDDEVMVYPSENYYYFELPVDGRIVAGNIGLSAHKIDEGSIYFAHYERVDKSSPVIASSKFGGRYFNESDGVFVEKINDFKYKISYDGRSVVFNFNQFGIDPPKKAKLTEDEVFVGPNFDESGMKFFLIYNNAVNRFYWLLNDEDFVPDVFVELNKDILIGRRTSFAFYEDGVNDRKILIGVYAFNVLNNNWYDGPFDQLPDNYIKTDKIKMQKYLEKVYLNARNNIDKYGHFLDHPGSRIAISSYLVYFYSEELVELVNKCRSYSNSLFYSCITPSEDNINPYYYDYLQMPDEEYEEDSNKR